MPTLAPQASALESQPAPTPVPSGETKGPGPFVSPEGTLGPAAAAELPRVSYETGAPARGPPSGTSQAPQNGAAQPPAEAELGELPEPEAGSPDSIAEISLDAPTDRSYTPSPESWSAQSLYMIILDRFARRGPGKPYGDPTAAGSRHGGNIAGLIDRLDYLKALGITTLLLNPVKMNPPGGYHGYWPVNFFAVDPHLGTMADFKRLVSEAHARGMYVVLDAVFNHVGPVIEYEDGHKWVGLDGPPKTIKRWKYAVTPRELMKPEHFHRRGSIDDWNDAEQKMFGDFPGGLNQLATENPETQDVLVKIALWWIREADIDGFRLDTYQHVAPSFWANFHERTRAYAMELGKGNFLMLGEIFHGDPSVVAQEMGPGKLDAAYDYPAYFADQPALRGEAPTKNLEDSLRRAKAVFGQRHKMLVRFLDNQDKPRFLREADPIGKLRVALAHTLLSAGIPYIYYGSEQAFRQYAPGELDMNYYREDMFEDGLFKSASSAGDKFDAGSPTFEFTARLAALRKEHAALGAGEEYVRWSDSRGPGIFAFSRIEGDEEVVVALNTADEPREETMHVDVNITPPGTTLEDALEPGFAVTAFGRGPEGGSRIRVQMPAHGVRVLIRRKAH